MKNIRNLRLTVQIKIMIILLTIISCANNQSLQQEVKIDLSGQHLKAIPDSVLENTSVTYLDLGSSNVTFYPPLSALADSNANEITYLPEKIGELTKLKTLILNSNQLTSLPNSITNLKDLEVLDLSLNKDLDIVNQLDILKQLHGLKILMIVGVKLKKDDIPLLKSSFPPDTKIILTIPEYLKPRSSDRG